MIRRTVVAALAATALAACGGGGDGSGPSKNAQAMADALKADIPSITKTVKITEENDPNNLIGRPGKYSQAVSIFDSRSECESDLDVTCGAKIEVFANSGDAKDRKDYIQTTLKAAQILGSEYDYVIGNALVRVTGELKPSEAKDYEQSLG